MGPTYIIVIAILALIIGGAVAYIIKAKKSGKKCIGCPDSCSCGKTDSKEASGGCSGNCAGCNGGCH